MENDPVNIYTVGYGGKKVTEIVQSIRDANALLVDVRYSPNSRRADFNLKNFEKLLGENYIWLPSFGNLNYRDHTKPHQLMNPGAGMDELLRFKRGDKMGRPFTLMCYCPDVSDCHRLTVAKWLVSVAPERFIYRGEWALPSDPPPDAAYQLKLV